MLNQQGWMSFGAKQLSSLFFTAAPVTMPERAAVIHKPTPVSI
jgi:hypothetical protein